MRIQIRHGKVQFWRKGAPIAKYIDLLLWTVQKRLNRSVCVWVVDSGGLKEAQVQLYSRGANVRVWMGISLAQPGGPREPCIRLESRSPHRKGQFWRGKGRPIVEYRNTLWSPVRKQLNRLWCHLKLIRPSVAIALLLLIRYVTLWPWPLTCWPWSAVIHGGSRGQPLHQVWRSYGYPFLSYDYWHLP